MLGLIFDELEKQVYVSVLLFRALHVETFKIDQWVITTKLEQRSSFDVSHVVNRAHDGWWLFH